jgi:hypothetical protein
MFPTRIRLSGPQSSKVVTVMKEGGEGGETRVPVGRMKGTEHHRKRGTKAKLCIALQSVISPVSPSRAVGGAELHSPVARKGKACHSCSSANHVAVHIAADRRITYEFWGISMRGAAHLFEREIILRWATSRIPACAIKNTNFCGFLVSVKPLGRF